MILTFDDNLNRKFIKNEQNNICIGGNQHKVYSSDSSIDDMLIIARCNEGHFGVLSQKYSTYDYTSSTFTNAYPFPVYSSCEDSDIKTSYPDFKNKTYKCKHYLKKDDGSYYCATC